jgi:hypothetical protein
MLFVAPYTIDCGTAEYVDTDCSFATDADKGGRQLIGTVFRHGLPDDCRMTGVDHRVI